MSYEDKIELEKLIKNDILSKKKADEKLDVFLESYFNDDIIDYQNATGLNLIWWTEQQDNDFNVKVGLA